MTNKKEGEKLQVPAGEPDDVLYQIKTKVLLHYMVVIAELIKFRSSFSFCKALAHQDSI